MSVRRDAVKLRRFRTRFGQVVLALLLPEHPKLFVVDWSAVVAGVGIDHAITIADQLLKLGLNPPPGTWLILEGGDVVGWAATMDDLDPIA